MTIVHVPNRYSPSGPSTMAWVEVIRDRKVEHECGMPICVNPEHMKLRGPAVVIVTEVAGNEGLSITNNAEAVIEELRVRFGDDVVVIEHYDEGSYAGGRGLPETFDLVEMGDDGHARWRHLGDTLEEALVNAEPHACNYVLAGDRLEECGSEAAWAVLRFTWPTVYACHLHHNAVRIERSGARSIRLRPRSAGPSPALAFRPTPKREEHRWQAPTPPRAGT